jgi:hypothetical protein
MTINCQLDTVTNSIAALTVTGVTIKDIHDIPENAMETGPIMFPRPDGFVTDMTFTRESQGGGGTALMNLGYTLTYVYCHAPIGSGPDGLFSTYSGMITNIVLILEKIFASDNITGAVDMQLAGVSNIGPVQDPAGNAYHGVEITLRVLEFIQ